jgi:hypothetical protein
VLPAVGWLAEKSVRSSSLAGASDSVDEGSPGERRAISGFELHVVTAFDDLEELLIYHSSPNDYSI